MRDQLAREREDRMTAISCEYPISYFFLHGKYCNIRGQADIVEEMVEDRGGDIIWYISIHMVRG